MRHDRDFATALANRLDHVERGAPADAISADAPPEVADLLRVAELLRSMPPVEPDPRWLGASRQRLLARFDAARGTLRN